MYRLWKSQDTVLGCLLATAARPRSPRVLATREGPEGGWNNRKKVYSADQEDAGRKVVGSIPIADKGLFLHEISFKYSPT